jgi:hypothetical protein
LAERPTASLPGACNGELCSILVYERGLIELEQAAHRC